MPALLPRARSLIHSPCLLESSPSQAQAPQLSPPTAVVGTPPHSHAPPTRHQPHVPKLLLQLAVLLVGKRLRYRRHMAVLRAAGGPTRAGPQPRACAAPAGRQRTAALHCPAAVPPSRCPAPAGRAARHTHASTRHHMAAPPSPPKALLIPQTPPASACRAPSCAHLERRGVHDLVPIPQRHAKRILRHYRLAS